MALPQGINFRGSAGYVTDGANEHGETAQNNYPTTSAQGNNVGWEGNVWGRLDRNSGNDARLAGIHYFASSLKQEDYRIDLPSSGSHTVRVAAGDAGGSNATYVELLDTTTLLDTLVTLHTGIGSQNFYDATDTIRTHSAWPGSNASESHTFSTTICRFRVGDNSTENVVIAHVYIEAAGGGGGTAVPVFRRHYQTMQTR